MRKTLIWIHLGWMLSTCDTQSKTGLAIRLALEPRHFRQGVFDELQVSWTRACNIKRTFLAPVAFSARPTQVQRLRVCPTILLACR